MTQLSVAEMEMMGIQKRLAKVKIDATLTKREQFAGMALQGLIANNQNTSQDHNELVKQAFSYADLMLKQSKENRG